MVVGGLVFYQGFFFFFFFLFFRQLISELAERNSSKIGHMLGSDCDLKTTFMGQLRNLTATLTVYIFGTKRDIDNRSSALTTTRGVLHRLEMS